MVWMLAGVILAAATAAAPAGKADELKTGTLNESARCGGCHEQIYTMWKRSLHGGAFTDPIFETSYMRAYMETAGGAKSICLRCHAPVATLTGDLDLKNPASREGITCDYCHSIVSVDLERRDRPFKVVLDGVKRGPFGDAESPAHRVAESKLHLSAEFCAGCHEYTNDDGLSILSTYSEWRASPQAAQGKTCQKCHMPLGEGDTARAGVGTGRKGINLHDISGGHSSEQVRRAATAKIVRVERQTPTSAVVEVEIANVGSGHSIPTGLPTRKLTLEVVLFANGKEVQRFERPYQRVLLDRQGLPILDDHRTILEARSIRDDNRLRAGERRIERFLAEVPSKGALRAEMHLRYHYAPQLLMRESMSIEIAADKVP